MDKLLDRRGFLKAGTAAASIATVASVAPQVSGEPIQSGSNQPKDSSYKILKSIKEFKSESYAKDTDTGDYETKLDCSLGTNPLGYSQTLKPAISAISSVDINSYPNFPYDDVKKALAEFWGDCASLTSDNIVIGTGSIGLLELINKTFVTNGSKVLGYTPQFSDYISDVKSLGGIYDSYKLGADVKFKFDADELIKKITPELSLIYIDNPNNPTGQIIPLEDIERIARYADPMGVCVIVDEAYGDFMDRTNSGINLVGKCNNVIVTKSFSKGFGLAGLRIGYMISSKELSAAFFKINFPFAVSNYAAYLAPEVLKDPDFLEFSMSGIKERKQKIMATNTRLEFMETSDTVPIFFARHPDENVHLFTELMKSGIKTEDGENFENAGKNYVRIRTPKEIDLLVDVLGRI